MPPAKRQNLARPQNEGASERECAMVCSGARAGARRDPKFPVIGRLTPDSSFFLPSFSIAARYIRLPLSVHSSLSLAASRSRVGSNEAKVERWAGGTARGGEISRRDKKRAGCAPAGLSKAAVMPGCVK